MNAELQAQIDTLAAQVAVLEADDSAGATKDAEQDAAIADMAGTDVGEVLTQVQDHEDAIAGLLTDVDAQGDSVEALESDVTDLESRADASEAAIDESETAIVLLDTRADAAETDISALETNVTDLTSRMVAVEGTNATQGTTIAAHASTLTSVASGVATLTSDLNAAEVDISTLETDVSTLTTKVSTLTSDMTTAQSDIDAVEGVNATQATTLTSHTTTIGSHTTTLAAHGTRLGDVETDVSAAQTDILDLELQGRLQRRTFNSETGQDTGLIPDRSLTFTKVGSTTPLHILYYDNFRLIGNPGDCRWEVLINGASCTAPGRLSHDGHTSGSINMHYGSVVEGICTATTNGPIAAGSVTLTVNLSRVYYPSTDCYTGWNSGRGMIEVFEITQ